MPRIPRNYRKYLLEREFRNHRPERLEEILAPSARSALEYVERYYPDPSSVRFREVYGPFMPSEERMIHPRGFSAALLREVERRKRRFWEDYMESSDPAPGIGWPPGRYEQLDEAFERQAMSDLDYELANGRSSKPVLPELRYKDARRPSRYDFMSPSSEAARDRLRMQGFDDVPYPEDSPFNRYR